MKNYNSIPHKLFQSIFCFKVRQKTMNKVQIFEKVKKKVKKNLSVNYTNTINDKKGEKIQQLQLIKNCVYKKVLYFLR